MVWVLWLRIWVIIVSVEHMMGSDLLWWVVYMFQKIYPVSKVLPCNCWQWWFRPFYYYFSWVVWGNVALSCSLQESTVMHVTSPCGFPVVDYSVFPKDLFRLRLFFSCRPSLSIHWYIMFFIATWVGGQSAGIHDGSGEFSTEGHLVGFWQKHGLSIKAFVTHLHE